MTDQTQNKTPPLCAPPEHALRDCFAISAMQLMPISGYPSESKNAMIAVCCYDLADAMLAERARRMTREASP